MSMHRQPRPLGAVERVAGFAAAGAAATATHWGAMAALIASGRNPVPATALGALLGAAVNYLAQRGVFGGHGGAAALSRYGMACVLVWFLNLLLFWLLDTATPFPVAATQLTTSVATAAISYLLYSRFVFHAAAPDPARA